MKLLESALVKEKKSAEATQQRKKRGRKEVVSESSGSSDSSMPSESDTESDKHASTKRRWKHASYERQHSTNRLAMKALRKAKSPLRKTKPSKASKKVLKVIEQGEEALEERLDYLTVADIHGYETAAKYAEGGGDAEYCVVLP